MWRRNYHMFMFYWAKVCRRFWSFLSSNSTREWHNNMVDFNSISVECKMETMCWSPCHRNDVKVFKDHGQCFYCIWVWKLRLIFLISFPCVKIINNTRAQKGRKPVQPKECIWHQFRNNLELDSSPAKSGISVDLRSKRVLSLWYT